MDKHYENLKEIVAYLDTVVAEHGRDIPVRVRRVRAAGISDDPIKTARHVKTSSYWGSSSYYMLKPTIKADDKLLGEILDAMKLEIKYGTFHISIWRGAPAVSGSENYVHGIEIVDNGSEIYVTIK